MKIKFLFCWMICVVNHVTSAQVIVPLGGNAFKTDPGLQGGKITDKGIVDWIDDMVDFETYIYFTKPGKVKVWLVAAAPAGTNTITFSDDNASKNIKVSGTAPKEYFAGEYIIEDTGYATFIIEGVSKTGKQFANIQSLKLEGGAINESTAFVKSNEGNFYYWGRRGPSVHLNYPTPANVDVEWFYNEITVPEGEDAMGSYFMAAGFGEGYFGIQVNSPTERRILFSVWSPFGTDDPKSIPDDQKIKMLKKGEQVYTGEFGNEGSGGQSFLKYNWQAGNTYKFLLHGMPDDLGFTTYTAYFFAPEKNEWKLIASFRRPKTNTYLKKLHSFLENFLPEYGNEERTVLFSNQWVYDTKGQWYELYKAKFTGDNTARKAYRLDYAGGISNNSFYLRNCGFFNNRTNMDAIFERLPNNQKPEIDFDKLP